MGTFMIATDAVFCIEQGIMLDLPAKEKYIICEQLRKNYSIFSEDGL